MAPADSASDFDDDSESDLYDSRGYLKANPPVRRGLPTYIVQLECKAETYVELSQDEWRRLCRLQDDYESPRFIPEGLYSDSRKLRDVVKDWIAATGRYRRPG